MNKTVKFFLLQIFLGLAFLFLWFKFVDLEIILSYFGKVNWGWALAALITYHISSVLRVWRWSVVLKGVRKIPFGPLLAMGYAGSFLNFLIPLRAGEFSRAYFLRRDFGIPFSKGFSTVVIDKMGDLLSMFFLVLVLLPFLLLGDSFPSILPLVVLGAFLCLSFLYLLAWQEKFCRGVLGFVFSLLPELSAKERLHLAGLNFIEGFRIMRGRPGAMFIVFASSVFETLIDGIAFLMVFYAFGYQIPILLAVFGFTLTYFAFLIPGAPGYIGTLEVAASLIFTVGLGIEKNQFASIFLFYRLLTGIVFLIIGFLALQALHFDLWKHVGEKISGKQEE